MCPEVTQEPRNPILDLQILLQCGQEVPDRRETTWRCWDISLSYAVSPPREVDSLSKFGCCLVFAYAIAPKWTVRSHMFPGIDVNLAFLHVMFSSVFELFSLTMVCFHGVFWYHMLVLQKVLVGGDGCPTFWCSGQPNGVGSALPLPQY